MDISNTLLCIPNHLSEDKDSFLYHFPYNILIVRIALNQGKKSLYTFDYQGDPKTYTNWEMVYYNKHQRDYYLKYSYDPDTHRYQASKYYQRKLIAIANGKDSWELFFQHVSLLNPVAGEPCTITTIGG